MYIRRALAAALVAIILSGIPALADYSDAEYRGTVNIANAGAAVSGVTVKLTTNTQAFIDSGILDASFNNVWFDSAAGAALAFMPKPGAISEWYFYYPYSLAATATTLSYLYMGGPDMSAPIRYLPGAAGMSTVDHASMEAGNNFIIEQKGYIDTTYAASKYLVYKSAAFQTVVSSDGVIASIIGTPTTVRPTGNADPGAAWTNEANAYDNNTGTQAGTVDNAPTGYLELTRATTATNAVRVWMHLLGDTSSTVDLDYYDGAAWHDIYLGVPPVLNAWHTYSLGDYATVTKLRIRRATGAAGTTLYVMETDWTAVSAGVTATVASGEHTIRTEADGTDLELYVDSVLQDSFTLGAVTVPNNGNAWTACVGGAIPYLEYHKQWVGGALKQHIAWENDVTFTDLSGTGNDATPSFPAASSDPDVTTTLTAMAPLAPAEAPGTSTDSGSSMAGSLPDEPDNLFGELDAGMEDIPGVAVVNAILDAGDIPRALFWFLFVFAAIVVLCLLTYHLSKSLMAMSLVAGTGMLFASKVGIVPYWVTVPLVLIALAVLVKEKMSPL
jgi:hypothetical protein